MEYRRPDGKRSPGRYLMTFDWADDRMTSNLAETPDQHKCAHLIALENGNFALQPNNRVLLFDPSFTTKYGKLVTKRKVNTTLWTSEGCTPYVTSDDDDYRYGVEKRDSPGSDQKS